MHSLKTRVTFLITLLAAGTTAAVAGTVSYVCDPTIDATEAGTCSMLNSSIANIYSSTFSNANASIYITMGNTELSSSTVGYFNHISYSGYVTALTSNANKSSSAIEQSAVAALNRLDTPIYSGKGLVVTSALAEALGMPAAFLTGTTAGGASCTVGAAGCYNGIITISTPANLLSETGQQLYWRQQGGTIAANAYDFYTLVEHETNEVLGTSSCISTDTAPLSNTCAFLGAGTPSAVDLFRYVSAATVLPDSALSTTPGAYFSYNGGVTNGADGAVYNTLDNGEDYADFVSNCTFVQDATGCTGKSGMDITNDGGAEINILNAMGYEEVVNSGSVNPTPEPASLALFGTGLAFIAAMVFRRSA